MKIFLSKKVNELAQFLLIMLLSPILLFLYAYIVKPYSAFVLITSVFGVIFPIGYFVYKVSEKKSKIFSKINIIIGIVILFSIFNFFVSLNSIKYDTEAKKKENLKLVKLEQKENVKEQKSNNLANSEDKKLSLGISFDEKDQKYIIIIKDTKMYDKPNRSVKVEDFIQLYNKDVIEYDNEDDKYYYCSMIEGEYRIVPKVNAKKINYNDLLITDKFDLITQKNIFSDLVKASRCSQHIAYNVFEFKDDLYKSSDYQRILGDLFSIQVLRKYKIKNLSIIYRRLKFNKNNEDWAINDYNEDISKCDEFLRPKLKY